VFNLRFLSLFIKNHSLLLLNLNYDIIAVDLPGSQRRFVCRYEFLSTLYNFRACIRVSLAEKSFLFTLSDIFSSADWSEREV
jgi:NADH:ubiquinone oxidoreductase subunit C